MEAPSPSVSYSPTCFFFFFLLTTIPLLKKKEKCQLVYVTLSIDLSTVLGWSWNTFGMHEGCFPVLVLRRQSRLKACFKHPFRWFREFSQLVGFSCFVFFFFSTCDSLKFNSCIQCPRATTTHRNSAGDSFIRTERNFMTFLTHL